MFTFLSGCLRLQTVVLLFVIVCCVHGLVTLTPEVRCLSAPGASEVTFTCMADNTAILWIYQNTNLRFYNNFSKPINVPEQHGIFTIRLTMVSADEYNYTSTATVSVSSLVNITTLTITCDDNGDGIDGKDAIVINGPPPAPTVTSITLTQSSTNSSSLLISWSMSDCAVQYVVTIINSSDGSVYPNITTSDTNTTVTLPTGVEFCVTVLGVDGIGRRGPASEPERYIPVYIPSTSPTITSSSSSSTSTPTPSSPTDPVGQPSQLSGGAIAGIVIAVTVIVLMVVAVAAVLVIYRKVNVGHGKISNQPVSLVPVKCACQMLCKEVGLNSWEVIVVFLFSKDYFEAMKMFYKDYKEYGSPVDCYWKSSGTTIEVKVLNKDNGWTVNTSDCLVHKADIERYTGKGEPPHIEMMITAASNKTTPPDLTVEAKLNGVQKPNIIKFEKEAQNVFVCFGKVFYHKEALNHWRARVAFYPKKHYKKVNRLYQDANNCSAFDVKFGGGVIKVSTDDTVIPAGWEVTINQRHQQVTTAAVEQYTGEGEPPYCEMTLRATDSDKSDLVILQPVTLIGVRQPNNIFNIERVLEAPDGTPLYTPQPLVLSTEFKCFCQVFYHKKGINHWKATLVFFTNSKAGRVKQFYQDANLGPTIKDVEFTAIIGIFTVNPSIKIIPEGWKVQHNGLKKIRRSDVVAYDGLGKPPYCEVTIKAVSDVIAPPDLTVTIIVGDVSKPANTLTISRVAETPPEANEIESIINSMGLPGDNKGIPQNFGGTS